MYILYMHGHMTTHTRLPQIVIWDLHQLKSVRVPTERDVYLCMVTVKTIVTYGKSNNVSIFKKICIPYQFILSTKVSCV